MRTPPGTSCRTSARMLFHLCASMQKLLQSRIHHLVFLRHRPNRQHPCCCLLNSWPTRSTMASVMQTRSASMAVSSSSRRPMRVFARATTKTRTPAATTSTRKEVKPSGLAVLAKIEQLGLLSKVEELGLLSKLEGAGFTLSKIEESGLLSKLETSGALSLVADKNTPGLLSTLGLLLVAGAGAVVYFTPDETTAQLALQAVGAAALGAGGVAALVGSNLLSDLQKP